MIAPIISTSNWNCQLEVVSNLLRDIWRINLNNGECSFSSCHSQELTRVPCIQTGLGNLLLQVPCNLQEEEHCINLISIYAFYLVS